MQSDNLKELIPPADEEPFIEKKDRDQRLTSIKGHMSKRSKTLYYYAKFMIVVGILGQSLFYLQAFKIYRQGSAKDVSLEGFLVALFSLTCWLIYGILIKDKVLVIVNIFGVLGAGLTILSILSVFFN